MILIYDSSGVVMGVFAPVCPTLVKKTSSKFLEGQKFSEKCWNVIGRVVLSQSKGWSPQKFCSWRWLIEQLSQNCNSFHFCSGKHWIKVVVSSHSKGCLLKHFPEYCDSLKFFTKLLKSKFWHCQTLDGERHSKKLSWRWWWFIENCYKLSKAPF